MERGIAVTELPTITPPGAAGTGGEPNEGREALAEQNAHDPLFRLARLFG